MEYTTTGESEVAPFTILSLDANEDAEIAEWGKGDVVHAMHGGKCIEITGVMIKNASTDKLMAA